MNFKASATDSDYFIMFFLYNLIHSERIVSKFNVSLAVKTFEMKEFQEILIYCAKVFFLTEFDLKYELILF